MGVETKDALAVKELWTGTYQEGAATDSTGYIEIKDSSGTTRKLMVQA